MPVSSRGEPNGAAERHQVVAFGLELTLGAAEAATAAMTKIAASEVIASISC